MTDVAVVGGGPAGCAAALALRAHAPGLSVTLLEASSYAEPRIGETLPPPAAEVLRRLGVWDAFGAQGHRPAYGTAAAWGGAHAHDHDFFGSVHSVGWQLDRAAFDAMLASAAEARGVAVRRSTRVTGAEREGGGWRLALDGAPALHARFVIDATGPSASFARRQGGARARVVDRLAGFARFLREARPTPAGTLVEAFPDGWWYTAALPGGLRVAVCMTDSDLARPLRLDEERGWLDALRAAPLTSALLDGAEPCGPPLVRAARTRRLDPPSGDGWLAAGDAASAFDPLSSQGVLKALCSGIFAAYATGDLLTSGDERGMRRYDHFIRQEFAGYLRARARYYAEERRWPAREFWRRRHAPEPAAAP